MDDPPILSEKYDQAFGKDVERDRIVTAHRPVGGERGHDRSGGEIDHLEPRKDIVRGHYESQFQCAGGQSAELITGRAIDQLDRD